MCIASVPFAMGKPSTIGHKYLTFIQVHFSNANMQTTAVQLESEREANSDFTEHPGLHIDSTEGTKAYRQAN